jgi:hypothetical protein
LSPLTLQARTEPRTHRVALGSSATETHLPGADYPGPRGRFRVIVRRPLPPPYRLRRAAPRHPLKRALAIAGVPAVLLITYVALWTVAMHGGYYKQSISSRIEALQIENDNLQAHLRQLQSPRQILAKARMMGMKPAEAIEFVEATTVQRVAQTAPVAPPPSLAAAAPLPRWSTRRR